jgi:hypothetical protein
MSIHRITCILAIVACSMAAQKRPAVAVPTNEPGTTRPASEETIPQATLADMFRTELGAAYDPVQADQLYGAHQLIEKYFEAHTAVERRSIIGQLEATEIDPNVLGRLCRIRSHWPTLAGGGIFYLNQKVGTYDARYFLGVPKTYDRTRAWPLVIKLPGATAFLTNPAPDAKRVVEIYTAWMTDELSKHGDAIVLMPLLNLDEVYGPSYAGMNSVIFPMLDAAERVNIDPARVYMVGHSMAAHGVWNLALHYPTYFAAINPMAGSANEDWQRLRLVNLRNVLPVVWHDDSDTVIKVNFSKSIVNALREQKVAVDFLETKGIGHAPTDEIVQTEYAKMRAKVRSLYPPQVWLQTNRPDVILNRSDWVQIYQPVETGKERNLFFRHGTGHMTIDDDSCSIKAEIANNRITISSDNINTFRLYVNDQLANMAMPVTVVVNKKVKFEGVVKASVEEMLNDQTFLGRGWRYYSGVIDIEMVPPATRPSTRPTTRPLHTGKITVGPSENE